MRILLIENSLSLRNVLKNILLKERFDVQLAEDAESGLELALTDNHDLIILDIMMPERSGYDVLRGLRRNRIQTPIILLTELSQENNKNKGQDIGAYNYLPKPFTASELTDLARALIKRKKKADAENILKFENVCLNLSAHILFNENNKEKSVKLTKKEYDVIRYFFERPRQVAETELVLRKVWGYDEEDNLSSPNFEIYVSFLRRKLKSIDASFTINPVRGIGYQLGPNKKDLQQNSL